MAYKVLNMQENKKYVKHETHLQIDSMIYVTEKLKGAEKVAMQVLHFVMTYDYKENTCNEKKNTHNYVMYIRKYGWALGRRHCLPTQCLPPRSPRPCYTMSFFDPERLAAPNFARDAHFSTSSRLHICRDLQSSCLEH